jgi:hypothetical protein
MKVRRDDVLQLCRLIELGLEVGDEARHLLLERFAVVLDILRADVATGRQNLSAAAISAVVTDLQKPAMSSYFPDSFSRRYA